MEMEMQSNHDILLQSFQSFSISTTTLDFNPEFAHNTTPEEFVAAVNHYLNLHSGQQVHRFRLFFTPYDTFLPDIENWIAFAISKGVEELVLDFSLLSKSNPFTSELPNGAHSFKLPSILFHCKSLTRISLSHCDFIPPSNFTGFGCLQSLSLTHVAINEEVFHHLLGNCPLLNSLSLRNCMSHTSIKVSAQDLRLQRLSIQNCWNLLELEISAPKLESFIFNGELAYGLEVNAPSLVDACICSLGAACTEPEHDYTKLLTEISHVQILSVCWATLLRVTYYEDADAEKLPIQLPNLKELQILLNHMSNDDLDCIYGFFRLCPSPFLETLYFQLPRKPDCSGYDQWSVTIDQWSYRLYPDEPLGVVFSHLKAIKLSNFMGGDVEMRLVRFLLQRALVLETLVLIAPEKPQVIMTSMDQMELNELAQEAQSNEMMDMVSIREQLALLPKASVGANIVLSEYLEDDKALNPTHTVHFRGWEVYNIM